MAQTAVLLWLGAALLLAGAVVAGVTGIRRPASARPFHWLVGVAAGVLGVAYVATVLEVATTSVATGGTTHTVALAWYAGWLLAGPTLLAALWLLAGGRTATLGAIVALVGFAFALGVSATLSTEPIGGLTVERTRLALWAGATVLVVALLGVILRVLSPQAGRQPRDVAVRFSVLRNLVVLVAVLYPVAWLVGPLGLGVVGTVTAAAIRLGLDVVAVLLVGGLLLRDGGTLVAARQGRAGGSG